MIYKAMTKFILIFMFVLALRGIVVAQTATDSTVVSAYATKADMLFFFDSISYDHGKWQFELSRNSMGMLWRTINGKDDVTGVCSYKQTLIVPKSSTFELKTQDMAIHFSPAAPSPFDDGRPAFIVSKRIGRHSHFAVGGEAFLEIGDTGKWSIGSGED
jgi:hypothetical protein